MKANARPLWRVFCYYKGKVCHSMQTLTDRELKEYALVGLLVRIDAESSRHPLIKDKRDLELCESRLEKMQAQYNELLADLRQSADE